MSGVRGDAEVIGNIRKAQRALGGPGMLPAVRSGGNVLLNGIKPRAPFLSGNLRRSYHQEDGRVTATSASVLVGTDLEYAPYQEFGTRYQSGTPHVRPAIDAERGRILREIADAAEALLNNAL